MKNIRIEDIEIEVIRKNIKNIYITIYKLDGKVQITAPRRTRDEEIWDFALSKLAWVKRHRSNKYQEVQPVKEYVSGEKHLFKGQEYLLNVIYTEKKQKVEIHNNQINLYIKEGSTREQRERVMKEWYRSWLKEEIPKLIEKWEQIIGVKIDFFGVKLMKTRWGTCNPDTKRIWINLELAKRKPRCLEYIVVHELVHLLERYHNKRFYAYMDQYLPHWKEIRKELK